MIIRPIPRHESTPCRYWGCSQLAAWEIYHPDASPAAPAGSTYPLCDAHTDHATTQETDVIAYTYYSWTTAEWITRKFGLGQKATSAHGPPHIQPTLL